MVSGAFFFLSWCGAWIHPSRRRARCQHNTRNYSGCRRVALTEECETTGSAPRIRRWTSSLQTLIDESRGIRPWRGCARSSTSVRRSIPRVASFEVRNRWANSRDRTWATLRNHQRHRSAGSSASGEAYGSLPDPLASTSWQPRW